MKKIIILSIFAALLPNLAYAAIVYVDGNLASNCTNGTYDIASRTCGSGSDGNGYTNIKDALSASSSGDNIRIRGGTYTETNLSTWGKSNLTVEAYANELVTIHGSTVYQDVFTVYTPTTFRNLTITGTKYGPAISEEDWTQYTVGGEEHVWYTTTSHRIIQIYFNLNEGIRVLSLEDVDSEFEYYSPLTEPWNTYVYVPTANTNPAVEYSNPGMRETSEYHGNAFSGAGASTDLVTIDNCEISGFSHTGVKLDKRWHIKNCYFHDNGSYGDTNDHHIYISSRASEGNEVIIEYNRFGYVSGNCISHYPDPAHLIIKYNIFDGSDGAPNDQHRPLSAISLNGENTQIYGNTITNCTIGIHMRLEGCHNNTIENNLFDGNERDIDVGHQDPWFPLNNTVRHNFLGSTKYCQGCTDETENGGDNYATYYSSSDPYNNIVSSNNPFVAGSPSNWYDFRLGSGSECIDTGASIGSDHADALDPSDISWPRSKLNQDIYGSGWEIGAFIDSRSGVKVSPPQNLHFVNK